MFPVTFGWRKNDHARQHAYGTLDVIPEIHVFSPSVFLDNAWDVVVKYAKTLDTEDCKSTFHDSWDEPALLEIMAKQRKKIQDLKLTKTKKNLPQIIFVCDDLADTGVMHNATNALATCFIRGRHWAPRHGSPSRSLVQFRQ